MRKIALPRALDAHDPSPVSSSAHPLTCAPPPIETPFRTYARLGLNFGDIFATSGIFFGDSLLKSRIFGEKLC